MKALDLLAVNQHCSHCGVRPLPEDYVVLQRWYEILFFLVAVVRSKTKKLEDATCILKRFHDTNNYITICFEHVGEVFQQFKNTFETTPANEILALMDKIDEGQWFKLFGEPGQVLQLYGEQFLEENSQYFSKESDSLDVSTAGGETSNGNGSADFEEVFETCKEGTSSSLVSGRRVEDGVVRVRAAMKRATKTSGSLTRTQRKPRTCKICSERLVEHEISSTPFKLFIMLYAVENGLWNKEQVRESLLCKRLVVCGADMRSVAEMLKSYMEACEDGEVLESVDGLKEKIEKCLLGGIRLSANIRDPCKLFLKKNWRVAEPHDSQKIEREEAVETDDDNLPEAEPSTSSETARRQRKPRNIRECTVCHCEPASTVEVLSKDRMLLIAFSANKPELLKVKARSWRVCNPDLRLAAENVMHFLGNGFKGYKPVRILEEKLTEFTESLDDVQLPKDLLRTCRTFCLEYSNGESTHQRRRVKHSPDSGVVGDGEGEAGKKKMKSGMECGSKWRTCRVCKQMRMFSELTSQYTIAYCLISAELTGKIDDAKSEFERSKRLIVCFQCLANGAQFISSFLNMKGNNDFDETKLKELTANVERISGKNFTTREVLRNVNLYRKQHLKMN